MLIHLYVIYYCLCGVFIHVTVGNDVQRNTYCYGDSSHANNLIDIKCPTGVIHVLDVIAAAKPSVLGCPAQDHDYTPAEQDKCCTYNSSDCMTSYTGNTESYYNCSGKVECRGVPIVFQQSTCNTTYPPFTNYLIIEYSCVQDGLLNGACSTTSDCIVNDTVCLSNVCKCQRGFTEYDAICMEDGIPNGACFDDNTCADINAYCSTETNRCICRAGYTEDQEQCIQVSSQVERPGFCYGDSSHANNLIDVTCTSGVIHVLDILTGSKPSSYGCPENDQVYTPALQDQCCTYNASDCISSFTGETDAYFACSGKTHCQGIPVVRQQSDCEGLIVYPRFSNYLIFEYVCVPEGQIHGSCDSSEVCVDHNSECYNATCQCVDGFSDQEHSCWEVGTTGVDCLPDQTCLDPHAICSVSTSTCICVSGYSLIDGACAENCTSNADCSAPVTVCSNGLCVCEINYNFVYGECKPDEEVGGRCSHGGTCRDTNADCASNNICRCTDGYSLVESTCKQDGTVGGICGTTINIDCIDENADCIPSTSGTCNCAVGYQNVSGICKPDGCVECTCEGEGDCTGSNIECGPDLTCRCNQGYSEVHEVCRLDGSLDGNCLADNTCLDIHAICINSRCQCNDVKNYVTNAGVCVRGTGYLNGDCNSMVTCKDENAYCEWETGRCSCKNNFVEVNGICEQGDTSVETACLGASPYNTRVPHCDRDSFAVEIRTYNRSKLTASGCHQTLDTYNHTYYRSCCTFGQDDCTEDSIGIGDCSPVYYTITEYTCLHKKQLVDVEKGGETNGTDIGLVKNEDYDVPAVSDPASVSVYNCSVQASCLTDIDVFVLSNTLQKVDNVCSCNVSIIQGGSTTEVTCEGPVADHSTAIFRAINGFVQVRISYRVGIQGGFTILFRAIERNAILTAHCGRGAKTIGISNLDTCGQIETGYTLLEVNKIVGISGLEVGIVPPGYKNGTTPDWSTEPSVYSCSIQASCQTDIDVFVLINTLEKVNGICSCNVSIIGDGSATEVTCDEPRANGYKRIYSASSGFVRAEIKHQGSILGHFLVLFRATHPNAVLTLACGAGAKLQGNTNLPTCDALGTGNKSVEVDKHMDIDGFRHIDFTNPSNESGNIPSTGPDPVTYQCSIQASCITVIRVFVLLNTLESTNNVCSCNITVFGDDVSTDINCDGPAAIRYAAIFTVQSGFSRIEISFHNSIRGSFIIRFQAEERYAKLTGTCGNRAKLYGIQNLQMCVDPGPDYCSITGNADGERSCPECSVTSPDYPSDNVTSASNGLSVSYCSVQASCRTEINVFVLLNTLRQVDGICSCNITLNGGGATTDITCDGPPGNYFTPIFSVSTGFVRTDIRYRSTIYGSFVLLFRAVEEYAKLTVSCGNKAQEVGRSSLGNCPAYGNEGSSVEVHRNETRNDTDVSITNPGYTGGSSVPSTTGVQLYHCSVQASCLTQINVFLLLNTLQKTNDNCRCNISLTAGGVSSNVTCDGPPNNRYIPILSTATGFVKVDITYGSDLIGNFVIEFRAVDRDAVLNLGCGNRANQTGLSNLAACPEPPPYGHSTIQVDDNNSSVNTEVSVTNSLRQVSGPRSYTCSVQASCRTAIDVYVERNTLQEINGQCSCIISVIGSASTGHVTCNGPGSDRFTPMFTEPIGFLRLHVNYTNEILGEFQISFKGTDVDKLINVSCGNKAEVQGWPTLADCSTITTGAPAEESSSSSSLILIIIPVVVVVVLLLAIIILCWVFRQRIRAKLCPQKQKPSVEPIKPVAIIEKPVVEGPSPMNTKFPGRTPEDGTGTASIMTMADYLFKEEIDMENSKNLTNNTLVLPKKGTEDTVVRTKFNRKLTLQEELVTMAHVHEEEEKMKEEKQQRKEKKRLKKLKKKLRKARVGITSANAFSLPTTVNQEPTGTYRPLVDDSAHHADVPPPSIQHATSRLPPLPLQGSSTMYPGHGSLLGPGLPDFSAVGLATDHPRPGLSSNRLPPLAFQNSSLAWKKAGIASMMVGNNFVKKKKTLEIISVDNPTDVERSEMD